MIDGTNHEVETTRRADVEHLFFHSYSFINEQVMAHPILTMDDHSLIVEGVAQHLDAYPGELSDKAFQSWTLDILKPAIEFYALKREHAMIVRKAIWSIVGASMDLGVDDSTLPVLETTTWFKVWAKMDELTAPGTAKVSTRIYAVARFQALGWRTKQLRDRAKFIGLDEVMAREQHIERKHGHAA